MSYPTMRIADMVALCLAIVMIAMAVSLPIKLFMLQVDASLFGGSLILAAAFVVAAIRFAWQVVRSPLSRMRTDSGTV